MLGHDVMGRLLARLLGQGVVPLGADLVGDQPGVVMVSVVGGGQVLADCSCYGGQDVCGACKDN